MFQVALAFLVVSAASALAKVSKITITNFKEDIAKYTFRLFAYISCDASFF